MAAIFMNLPIVMMMGVTDFMRCPLHERTILNIVADLVYHKLSLKTSSITNISTHGSDSLLFSIYYPSFIFIVALIYGLSFYYRHF